MSEEIEENSKVQNGINNDLQNSDNFVNKAEFNNTAYRVRDSEDIESLGI